MGKRQRTPGYQHKRIDNPKAQESVERRLQQLQSMEISRLKKSEQRIERELRQYISPEERLPKSIDPKYDLKGAARAARAFYTPSVPEATTVDLIEKWNGKMWQCAETRELLRVKLQLGDALHNVGKKTNDALAVFKEMLLLDVEDHIRARDHLLRCYLDLSQAEKARELVATYPLDTSSLFTYTQALLEHISLSLGEEGASERVRDGALKRAYDSNSYTLWALAYHESFTDAVEHVDKIDPVTMEAGGIEDALNYFECDREVWIETDGAIDWLRQYIDSNSLTPPSFVEPATPSSNISTGMRSDETKTAAGEEEKRTTGTTAGAEYTTSTTTTTITTTMGVKDLDHENHVNDVGGGGEGYTSMFLGMFYTALEMAHVQIC